MIQVTDKYVFDIDQTILKELGDQDIYLEDEILRKEPNLGKESISIKPEKGEKEVVSVITATALLAPIVVPIALELIRRFVPKVECEETMEILADGTIIHRTHIKQI